MAERKESIKIEIKADGARVVKRDLKDIGDSSKRSSSDVSRLQRSMKSLSNTVKSAARNFFSFRNIIGLVAGTTGLGLLIRNSLEAADSILQISEKVGTTTNELQQLRFAASQVGVGTGEMDVALQRFSRRLGEAAKGMGSLYKTVQDYDIQIKNADGSTKSTLEVFKQFADVISNAKDSQEQLAIAFKAFDSGGAQLVNLLRQGGEGVQFFADEAERLGLVLDESAIKKASQANTTMTILSQKMRTEFTRAVAENADAWENLFRILISGIDVIGKTVRNVTDFVDKFRSIRDEINNLDISNINDINSDGIDGAIDSLNSLSGAAVDQSRYLSGLKSEWDALVLSLDPAEQASRILAETQEKFNILVQDGVVSIDEYNETMKKLEESLNGVSEEQLKLQEQLRDIENAVRGVGKTFENELVEAFTGAGFDFKKVIDSMIKDLIRLAIQLTIIKPLFGSITGVGGKGGLFSGIGGSSVSANDTGFNTSSVGNNVQPLNVPRSTNVPRGTSVNNSSVTVNVQGGLKEGVTPQDVASAVEEANERSFMKLLQRESKPGGFIYGR